MLSGIQETGPSGKNKYRNRAVGGLDRSVMRQKLKNKNKKLWLVYSRKQRTRPTNSGPFNLELILPESCPSQWMAQPPNQENPSRHLWLLSFLQSPNPTPCVHSLKPPPVHPGGPVLYHHHRSAGLLGQTRTGPPKAILAALTLIPHMSTNAQTSFTVFTYFHCLQWNWAHNYLLSKLFAVKNYLLNNYQVSIGLHCLGKVAAKLCFSPRSATNGESFFWMFLLPIYTSQNSIQCH